MDSDGGCASERDRHGNVRHRHVTVTHGHVTATDSRSRDGPELRPGPESLCGPGCGPGPSHSVCAASESPAPDSELKL